MYFSIQNGKVKTTYVYTSRVGRERVVANMFTGGKCFKSLHANQDSGLSYDTPQLQPRPPHFYSDNSVSALPFM